MKNAALAAFLLVFALSAPRPAAAQRFNQVNLVSDQPGLALHTDSHLINPWGLAPGGSGVFWVNNNGTGTSTLYDPDGTVRPLVVSIPGGDPTGIVATSPGDSAFDIPNGATTGRAAFIFVTQSGSISAWSPAVNQTQAIEVSSDTAAVYTGAALGGTATNPLLYVADFKGGTIDAYDSSFVERKLAGSFTDPNLPAGYGPFNIANIGGRLYVAYAPRTPQGDELPGPGAGLVDVFDLQGTFIRRFATGAELNAPWAIVRAPAGWGSFGGDILVGNFGDGRVLAFDQNGTFQEALRDSLGQSLVIHGLWGLAFGKPVSGTTVAKRLYFAAGIADETHGLFGFLAADTDSVVTGPPVACRNDSRNEQFWRKQCKLVNRGHGHGDDQGDDDQGDENDQGEDHDGGDRREHRGFLGAPSDSLDTLFRCIAGAPAPNVFGANGCFTAGCDLLKKGEKRTDRELAAQVLLVTRLNLCSGAACDSTVIPCGGGRDTLDVRLLGEVADSLDALLCQPNADRATIRGLVSALSCVLENGGRDRGDEGDDDGRGESFLKKLAVRTISLNPMRLGGGPVRFALSSPTPAMVQLRIYDIRGRLVAEPLHNAMVVGTANPTWDGNDLRGQRVAPGTYFYRAITANESATGRLLIVR